MSFQKRFTADILPALQKELKISNALAAPRVRSISVGVGLSPGMRDAKMLETAESVLTRITGQKPARTKAKQSISNFKIRKGQVIGIRVTLRGPRMWDFLDKLVNITFPRIRDFRGISVKHVDRQGNLSVGFREFLPFPEIRPDEVERVHGLQVTVATTAGNVSRGTALFRALGFPFRD